ARSTSRSGMESDTRVRLISWSVSSGCSTTEYGLLTHRLLYEMVPRTFNFPALSGTPLPIGPTRQLNAELRTRSAKLEKDKADRSLAPRFTLPVPRFKWRSRQDSHLQPPRSKRGALVIELRERNGMPISKSARDKHSRT